VSGTLPPWPCASAGAGDLVRIFYAAVMASLAGKAALVTGGGTGIGAAIAEAFAGAGACVAVTGRRAEPLERTARLITDQGGTALTVRGDVADLDAMTGAVHQALATRAALGSDRRVVQGSRRGRPTGALPG